MSRKLVERELTQEGPRRVSAMEGSAKGKCRSVTVNLRENPIAWLHARGHLSDRLHDAAEALRNDYERAQLSPSITMRWDPVRVSETSSCPSSPSERQLAAKQRFDGAIAHAGSGLADVLWRVVCAGEGLPDAERSLGWPARSGKLVLNLALERVADYYRI